MFNHEALVLAIELPVKEQCYVHELSSPLEYITVREDVATGFHWGITLFTLLLTDMWVLGIVTILTVQQLSLSSLVRFLMATHTILIYTVRVHKHAGNTVRIDTLWSFSIIAYAGRLTPCYCQLVGGLPSHFTTHQSAS